MGPGRARRGRLSRARSGQTPAFKFSAHFAGAVARDFSADAGNEQIASGCFSRAARRKTIAGCWPNFRAEVWGTARIVAGSDRDSGLAAALGKADGIAVNAGTGASVTGRRGERIEKAGGWGHILGDAGGGYFLSLQALRFILREYDLHRGEAQFTASILRALALNSRDDLVRWAQTADKLEVASLAPVVFRSGDERRRTA